MNTFIFLADYEINGNDTSTGSGGSTNETSAGGGGNTNETSGGGSNTTNTTNTTDPDNDGDPGRFYEHYINVILNRDDIHFM